MTDSAPARTDRSVIQIVTIRQVEREDLPGLEWEGEFSHFRRVYASEYQRGLQGLSVLWVAELGGFGLVGQVFVQLKCDRTELADGHNRAYFYAFRVRPTFRSLGLGTRLLNVMEKDLLARGFRFLCLNVAKDNERARNLYSRRGYRVIAEEPGLWSFPDENGVWCSVEEPAWRMEKHLTTGETRTGQLHQDLY